MNNRCRLGNRFGGGEKNRDAYAKSGKFLVEDRFHTASLNVRLLRGNARFIAIKTRGTRERGIR
jgi:hypothetical protein